jgi:DNA alkylation repair enzyme
MRRFCGKQSAEVESQGAAKNDALFEVPILAQKPGFPKFPQRLRQAYEKTRRERTAETPMPAKRMAAKKKIVTRKGTRLELLGDLEAVADERKARNHACFFRTRQGEYGEGDQFLGISVPMSRKIALRYRHLPLTDIAKLLASPIHEHRFAALEILVVQYERGDEGRRQEIFDFYLENTHRTNNWDLVDTSATYIVGEHLLICPIAHDPI